MNKILDILENYLGKDKFIEYTCYSCEALNHIFILEHPGAFDNKIKDGTWQQEEFEAVKKCKSLEELITIERKAFTSWITSGQNEEFFEKFTSLVNKYCGLEIAKDASNFFDKFYATDAVKHRPGNKAKGKDAEDKQRGEHFEKWTEEGKKILKEELKILSGSAKLAFIFSSLAWRMFLDITNENGWKLTEVSDKKLEEKLEGKITKDHGKLFRIDIDENSFHVIPLSHFSGRSVMNNLRDSYFRYLEEGLEKYQSNVAWL